MYLVLTSTKQHGGDGGGGWRPSSCPGMETDGRVRFEGLRTNGKGLSLLSLVGISFLASLFSGHCYNKATRMVVLVPLRPWLSWLV